MPPLSREQIELLAEKKLSGTITPEEQVLLDQWLNQEPGERMAWASGDSDEATLRERLLKRIKKDAGISHYPKPARIIPVLYRYRRAAAAVLLLAAAGGSYLLFFKKEAASPGITHINSSSRDMPPGHSGAILTLANGDKIVLDSAGNGKIGVQGIARLVKQNGELAYEKTTGGTAAESNANIGRGITYNTMTTPRGRQFKVVLSDGSKVWLNAASSITYPTAFTGAERKVTITGEVYFEVARDPQHPFIVSAEQARITVLGTHFDVMAYPDEKQVKTTLLEGSVRVSKGEQQVIIAPGQQASFSPQSDHISVEAVETSQVIAWVKEKLSLDNLDVRAIMRQVSRWYDVDVVFEEPVPQGRFWGVINRNVNLSSVLSVMKANGIDTRLEGNKVIVLSKK